MHVWNEAKKAGLERWRNELADDRYFAELRQQVIDEAAKRLSAVPADIPGLWIAPDYPELTTGQLVSIAFPGYTGTPLQA